MNRETIPDIMVGLASSNRETEQPQIHSLLKALYEKSRVIVKRYMAGPP